MQYKIVHMYFIPKSLKQRALKITLAAIELSVNGKKQIPVWKGRI